MNEKNTNPFESTEAINPWLQSLGSFWSAMTTPPKKERPASSTPRPENHTGNQASDTVAAALKNWQALTHTLSTPESLIAFLKSGGAIPEMMFKLSQTSMDGMEEMHQRIFQQARRMGESVEAYQFTDIDENMCRLWTDIYEKEFRQYFQIPQLGLMRQYQERVNQAADKYNLFQSKLSEYLNLLSMPFSRASQVMQEKIGVMMENDELPEDPKTYYNLWIKVLEGHFMTLYQTPEYVETLACTLNALADFSAARDAVIEDALDLFPVAKQTDLDDMARELYTLKKRVKALERMQHPSETA